MLHVQKGVRLWLLLGRELLPVLIQCCHVAAMFKWPSCSKIAEAEAAVSVNEKKKKKRRNGQVVTQAQGTGGCLRQ